MSELRFKVSEYGRPIFTSNGVRVLFDTGYMHISLLDPDTI
jgi:hypothetical protein